MVDLYNIDKGNISLPSRLQSPDLLGENEKKDLEEKCIINIQKALYDVKLSSLNQCIQNLKLVNDDLESVSKDVSDTIAKTDKNTKEDIKSWKEKVSTEEAKVNKLKEQLQTKTRLKDEEREKHLEYVQKLAQKYIETYENLTSQLNAMNQDIEMLETFKINESKLWGRFNETEKLIETREEEHESTMKRIEDKYKSDKEKITDNIFEILFEMAKKFHIETIENLSMPFCRLVNESISIKSELNELQKYVSSKENKIEESKSELAKNCSIVKKHRRCLASFINKIIDQNQLAKFIKENCIEPIDSDLITKASFSTDMQMYTIENIKNKLSRSIIEENSLKVVLYREKINLYGIQNVVNRLICRCELLKATYYDMKFVILCAMQKSNSQDETLQRMDSFELAIHLLNIIRKTREMNRCCKVLPY